MHLGKLQGQSITMDVCNTTRKLGQSLVQRTDKILVWKNITPLVINSKEIKMKVNPYQYH